MASLAHAAFGAFLGRVHGDTRETRATSVALFACLAVVPDADVLGAMLGARDGGPLGHRGFTHSLLFAAALACVAAVFVRQRKARTAAFVFAALASHGILDAMTFDGGGVPLLWPLSDTWFLLPWAPFAAAPKGLSFLSVYGGAVAFVEAACVLPLLAYALLPQRWQVVSGRARVAVATACLLASLGTTALLARSAPALALLAVARSESVAMAR